jgi:tRNA (guanine-N7-)-methyltransferase
LSTNSSAPSRKPADGLRRLWGRHRGHALRAGQARLIEERLPALRVPIPDHGAIDPAGLFGHDRPLWVEIGFGGGEHLAAQAQANPHAGFIGAEHFVNGIAKLLAALDQHGIGNVRIHDADARDLLERLPDASVERLFLLFPDPWPKTRHHKRRFVQPETLAQMARVLADGGILRIASDIPDYVRWTLVHMVRAPDFEWLAEGPRDWHERPADWPGTRYEAKAIREGRQPAYLAFRRRPR